MFERRTLTTLGSIAAAAGAIALVPATAGAAVSCSFSGATATVTVTLGAGSDVATVKRSGTAIQVNGVNCGTATVNNTDTIAATGTADGFQRFVADLSGGALGPGKTAESTGTSEIELAVDLRSGSSEEIQVIGGTGADTAIFGTAGANLNTDSDVDLTFSGLDQVELDGAAGADPLSVAGGGTAGSPLAKPSDIDGGAGIDTLTGGRASDTIVGGTEGDVISGGPYYDTLKGGDGNDNVSGGDATDYVDGDAGNDTLSGGPGGDYISYYGGSGLDGADVMAGGSGNDYLYLTSRFNHLIVKLDGLANDGGDVAGDGTAEEGDNVRPDIENVYLGSGNDRADARFPTARLFAHTFDGNGGNDSLYGGDEGDTLYGDDGTDVLDSGEGDDHLTGGNGNDQLTGGNGGDTLYPDNGDDSVNGGDGDDYMSAGAAGDGIDSWLGGTGVDRLYLGSRSADMSIVLDNVANDGLAGEGDNVRADIERIDSGSGNDTINIATAAANAVAANNEVYGAGGNDIIKSGLGEDLVYGGLGNDDITGGAGEDFAYGEAGADVFRMLDGYFDHIDGGASDGVNDTGTFDSYDEKVNFP
jgi:Ca2+-binding RTX toxin-like protein